MNLKIIMALIVLLIIGFAYSILILSSEIEQANNKQSSEKETIEFKERCDSMYGKSNWTEYEATRIHTNPKFIPIYFKNNIPFTCVQIGILP